MYFVQSWWENLPVIGGVIQWTQDAARRAIQDVMSWYDSYMVAKTNIPAERRLYINMVEAAQESDSVQRDMVADYGAILGDTERAIENGDSDIQRVVSWVRSSVGLGFPVIPIAMLVILGAAVVYGSTVVNNWIRLRALKEQIRARWTPEQITKYGLQTPSPIQQLTGLGMVLLVGAGLYLARPYLKGK